MDKKIYNRWRHTGILHGLDEEIGMKIAEQLQEFVDMWTTMTPPKQKKTKQKDSLIGNTCLQIIRRSVGMGIKWDMSKLYKEVKEESKKHSNYGSYHDIDTEYDIEQAIIEKYSKL